MMMTCRVSWSNRRDSIRTKYPLKFCLWQAARRLGKFVVVSLNAELFAATGNYVVVMINFHGSTGYGQKFTDSISGDWAANRMST